MDKINLDEMRQRIENSPQLSESELRGERPKQEITAGWEFWETMATHFPYAWTSREGDEPTEPWMNLLKELTLDQINYGFKKILSWEDDFPPTTIQFRQLCIAEGIAPRDKKGTGNSDAYLSIHDPRHSTNRDARTEYGESKHLRIDGPKYESNRKKAYGRHWDEMKGMFNIKDKGE